MDDFLLKNAERRIIQKLYIPVKPVYPS